VTAKVSVVELTGVSPALLDSYRDCALVESVRGFTRYERSLRFSLAWTADDFWYLRPGRDDADDVGRPGPAGLVQLLQDMVSGVWLDVADDWDIDVRQVRTVVTMPSVGAAEPTPDRYEHLMVAVLGRDRPPIGMVRVRERDTQRVCWEGRLHAGQALLMNGREVSPDLDSLFNGSGPGRQDVLVNGFARTLSGLTSGRAGAAARPGPP
jgi:hypothetical protein